MSALLVVPMKKAYPVDIAKPLKNLINSSYNGNNASVMNHTDALNALNELRNMALGRLCIKYESLEIIYNYYDQLLTLETKIPMHELQDVPFKWRSAFERKLFKGQSSLTLQSWAYEKQCVLFNIAALQSAVAAAQGTYRDDGFKLATQLLKQSAGIFAHLKSIVTPQDLTSDLDIDTLQVLSNLMLAQAQEIYVLKAIKHHMKESTVAKLASSCQYLYQRVLCGLQNKSIRSIWDKDWITTVTGKQSGFRAIAQYYQSLVCRSENAIGEEIARLQHSIELFNVARLQSGKPKLYEEFEIQAQRNFNESKKDNDLIYHATVPNVNTLVDPEEAQLANIIPFQTPLSSNSKDLFVHLVPIVLQSTINASDIRKSEIINGEVTKLRESTRKLNEILVRLNLPASIEIAVGSTLPRSIQNKAKEIREKGGINSLRTLITELPQLLKRNQNILDQTDRMVNDEAQTDARLRMQFKEQWTRTRSEKLTKIISANICSYRKIIQNAFVADKAIRETFEKHVRIMELLSKPISDLESACPIGSDGNILNCHSARKLRTLMDNIDAIKTDREIIESELKSATVDLKDQFLNALEKDGGNNQSKIGDNSIRKIFAPLCKRVDENLFQQDVLTEHIQSVYHDFEKERSGRSVSRDGFFSQLASAYDAFIMLEKHLKEGIKFYNDLTYLLITFKKKVSAFCSARETEKFHLIKFIERKSKSTTSTANQYDDLMVNSGQMDETTASLQLSSHITPMPTSFNPYATYTIKKFR